MPSLKVRVKKLAYKGIISDADCGRICEALEKQIPKKPKDRLHSSLFPDSHIWVCPVCGNEAEISDDVRCIQANYCYECGQKLDWSEE